MRIDERELFKSVMMGFILDEDPMLTMSKWIKEQLIQIEAETKARANKNEHNKERKTYEDAKKQSKQSKLFIQEYEGKYPEAIQCLEEGLEESLQFFHFDFIDHRCISSTNVLGETQRRG